MRSLLAAILILGVGSAQAASIDLDFSSYAPDTSLTYAQGVSFALVGGPDSGGAPTTSNNFGSEGGLLTNTRYGGDYPTAAILQFTFDGLVEDLSFVFNNAGSGSSGGIGDSFFQAFDESGLLLESGSINGAYLDLFNLTSSGIKTIQFNNNTGGTDSWWFGVRSLQAQVVPVPAAVWLFGSALAGLGWFRRRQTA